MASSSVFLSSLEDWEDFYYYISEYGVHVALWLFLSAVTVYRREISCNRSYHEIDENEENTVDPAAANIERNGRSSPSESESLRDEEQSIKTEELLEQAGLYLSVKPILNLAAFASAWRDCFPGGDEEPTLEMLENNLTTTDLLERAGNYASGEPIAVAMALFKLIKGEKCNARAMKDVLLPLSTSAGSSPFMRELPPDVYVHIASFLHPRDVVTLSCVSKNFRNVIDNPETMTSASIWKTLWKRDYAWIIEEWDIGKQAFQRSNCTHFSFNKDFYFFFGQSYLNYVLAGMNTYDQCLVGIHSNIYDITPFLFRHPGSPDTLMVHAGRDATAFFEDMGHSLGARRLAMSLCVVVDKSAQHQDDCGLFPTNHTKVDDDSRLPSRMPDGADNILLQGRRQSRSNHSGTLHRIHCQFERQKEQVRNRVAKKFANDPTVLGHQVNVYYCPFTKKWRVWYTDTDLRTVYLPA
mmetsp:Transcript_23066/g.40571  ORF Transcript_23066/g.40571 Transcript_23066/m.40571 type:complete len:467 (-) Transcript_23066:342-1742(-)